MKTRILVTALMLSASLTLMSAPRNYVGLVNTMQGTENSYELSLGRCRPMVGLPHSMHLWTPAGTGFASSGFSFVVSSEEPDDDFVMPRVIPYGKKPYDALAAMPHYFKAGYGSGAQVEATATEHCGMFRIRFSKSGNGYITFSAIPGTLKMDAAGRVPTISPRPGTGTDAGTRISILSSGVGLSSRAMPGITSGASIMIYRALSILWVAKKLSSARWTRC